MAAPAPAVHPVAEAGFGGAGLSAYEAARPSYPPEAVEHCIQRLGLRWELQESGSTRSGSSGAAEALSDGGAGSQSAPDAAAAPAAAPTQSVRRRPRVLDLAAGTGKLTRQLAATGLFDITAAEPSAGMVGAFEAACPGIEIVQADAARLPFEDGAFDAMFVGQAFHWFANWDACAEVCRVLRPGGGLALLWNLEDGSKPWMREFLDIFQPYARAAGVPNYGLGTHVAALESDWFAELFDVSGGAAACSTLFSSTRPLTKEGAWLRVLSNSFVASLPEAAREGDVRPAVEAWASRHADRFGAAGGEAEGSAMFEIVTEAFVCRRR